MTLNLAIIAGDGTGPEVTDQALVILAAVAKAEKFDFATKAFDFGGEHYLQTGSVLEDSDLDILRQYDAILLGAVGHPDVKPGILERGLLLKMRLDFDQYINLRPIKLYPGVETPLKNKTPDDIDMIVIRENTEDLYCGNGGITRKGTPHEISTQEMITTRFGVERCLRYAFETARTRKAQGYPGLLTLIHKTNVLIYCGDTWFRTFNEIGDADFADIKRDYHHVDACCMYMATSPQIYDTLVVSNMFGDIITDLGAAIAGGMGIASSGNLNPNATTAKTSGGPSMFEPVHGSSPDIAGQNKANPLAAIDSLAILLKETGRSHQNKTWIRAGERVNAAVIKTTAAHFTHKRLDRSGYTTTEIGQMILDAL